MAMSIRKGYKNKKKNLLYTPATILESDTEDNFTIPVEALPNVQIPQQVLAYDGLPAPAMISFIESPSLFYLHLVNSETATIDSFCSSMTEYYKGDSEPLQVNQLPLGSHWAVYSSDGLWYRCQILSNLFLEDQDIIEGGPRLRVRFIDYGYCSEVKVKDIRVLSEEFTLLPALAVPCCLAKVYPQHAWEKSPWSLESTEAFQKLCGEPDSILQTYFSTLNWSSRNEVILETTEGLVINEALVLQGHAISKVLLQAANKDEVSCEVTSAPAEAVENSADLETLPPTWNPMESAYLNPANSVSFDDECAESVFLGFRNRDESRLCKYFRRGLRCPRGDACRWEHVRQHEDLAVPILMI
nr:tudor and KH domain-containing protein-like isoform X1 [Penaeus vannamei]XP_027208591.1 tudor and KH domain-containing protein-like isoform X1 [Penaeus vannamei]XP_027208592.1 tudor and KH domain-containing protein-like isoform X1 [Penaeus vannamei]XP_027208593.1 tudor and KH domain-containing protein-like isoform X1 [Penaeus vannamei]XP_027208594.1 tudor and KH domain-containing protein-like isoform X1 [Penaeus vannamei]